jgi:hypothetical protein
LPWPISFHRRGITFLGSVFVAEPFFGKRRRCLFLVKDGCPNLDYSFSSRCETTCAGNCKQCGKRSFSALSPGEQE